MPKSARAGLADLMAIETQAVSGAKRVLRQHNDPILTNALGIVNGGVASARLELAASAAVNTGGQPMQTATMRVNFMRPFLAGGSSRYEAAPLRLGRGTAVANAQALGDDGRVAIVARLTATAEDRARRVIRSGRNRTPANGRRRYPTFTRTLDVEAVRAASLTSTVWSTNTNATAWRAVADTDATAGTVAARASPATTATGR